MTDDEIVQEPEPGLIAATLAGLGAFGDPMSGFAELERETPPWRQKPKHEHKRSRTRTRSDDIAFRKRVAKRRAKKGYK